MVAVHVRRRERASRFNPTSDCRTTLSISEFKALAGGRKHDFGEFETQETNAATITTQMHSTATNPTAETPVASACNIKSKQNPSLDGTFFYEDRSEPVEETLSFAGRGREGNGEIRDASPNVVEQHMDSESDNQSDSISHQELHSDESDEHNINNKSLSTLASPETKPASPFSFLASHVADISNDDRANSKNKKSILRSQAKEPLRSYEDRSISLRSQKSSFRSTSSSFRSSENESVSATSQKSLLQPIARIRVMVTDCSLATTAKKSTSFSNVGSKVATEDESDAPTLPSRASGDEACLGRMIHMKTCPKLLQSSFLVAIRRFLPVEVLKPRSHWKATRMPQTQWLNIGDRRTRIVLAKQQEHCKPH
jgi:hypothetical protein